MNKFRAKYVNILPIILSKLRIKFENSIKYFLFQK